MKRTPGAPGAIDLPDLVEVNDMNNDIYKSCQAQMDRSLEHYEKELRGIQWPDP